MENTPEARIAYWENQEEYALIALNYARKMLGRTAVDLGPTPEIARIITDTEAIA